MDQNQIKIHENNISSSDTDPSESDYKKAKSSCRSLVFLGYNINCFIYILVYIIQ